MPNAADLYFFEWGKESSKPPILLIHGAGGSYLHWATELRRLPGYHVLAPDLPGHGKSGGVGEQTIQGYAEAILRWMDALRLRPAIVIGHSMGSAIALTLALDSPARVRALGLIGSGARLRVAPAILEGTASETTFPATVQTITQWSFGSHASPRLKTLAAQRMSETRPTVLHGDFLACNLFDVMPRVEEIQVPALVLCGAEDKMTPPRYSAYLHEKIPNSTLKIIEGAGHMVMLEKPKEVAEALLSFLDASLP